jgi:hypothetical protein
LLAIAVQRRVVPPPTFQVQVGSLRIEAGVETPGECPPHCEYESPGTQQTRYTVWLITHHQNTDGESRNAIPLFAQPLR